MHEAVAIPVLRILFGHFIPPLQQSSADGFDAAQRYAIDRHWGGEIPFTLLVTPDGKVQTITGTMDFHRPGVWASARKR